MLGRRVVAWSLIDILDVHCDGVHPSLGNSAVDLVFLLSTSQELG